MDDRELILKTQKGDLKAYSLLVKKYEKYVFNLAQRILLNRQDAEEVTQDVFMKLFKNIYEFNFSVKFTTWVYRITYNMSISKIRTRKKNTSNLPDNFEEIALNYHDANFALDAMTNQEQKYYISQALNTLSEDDRTIMTLYYQYDNSIYEISQITGLNQANIKIKLYRARKKLFYYLSKELKEEIGSLV